MISPLSILWLLRVNDILLSFDAYNIRVVAYADDPFIMVFGMFPDILSELMQRALNRLTYCAASCRLDGNPLKPELNNKAIKYNSDYIVPQTELTRSYKIKSHFRKDLTGMTPTPLLQRGLIYY